MDFTNERYVRIYTRKTVLYVLYPWQTRAIRDLIFKELDRAGVLELGEYSAPEAVSAMISIPLDVVEVGLPPLLKDGTLVVTEGFLVSPNFIDAQEAAQSDKARQKASREKRRDLARLQSVTERDDSERRRSNLSQDGQNGHTGSQSVTPSLTVLNQPGGAEPATRVRAQETPPWKLVIQLWVDVGHKVTGQKIPVDSPSLRSSAETLHRLCSEVSADGWANVARRVFTRYWKAKHAKGQTPQMRFMVTDFSGFVNDPPAAPRMDRDAIETEIVRIEHLKRAAQSELETAQTFKEPEKVKAARKDVDRWQSKLTELRGQL